MRLAFNGNVKQKGFGAIAQLGERNTGSVEVSGSIPLSSTKFPLSIKGLREEGHDLLSGEQKLDKNVNKNSQERKKGLQALFFRLKFHLFTTPFQSLPPAAFNFDLNCAP